MSVNELDYVISISRASGEIVIDGLMTEQAWKTADVAKDFYQIFPTDTTYSITKTEVKILFDDEQLYIAAICYDDLEGDYIIQSLKRDFSYPISDAFAVFIDPFGDQTNGFSFAVNPLGVQREGLISGGGDFGVTTSWDNKWFSAVTRTEKYWIVEMAIPFKTIRYAAETTGNPNVHPDVKAKLDNKTVWRINFSRNDLKRNEASSWYPVPKNFNVASLIFTGYLVWNEPPPKAGSNISIIPYAIASSNNYTEAVGGESSLNAGFDAKIAVSSSLNLDLTINPDFSQVEVDQQIINLTNFSLFFPEKRQFFIENSDLFSNHGFRQIRPFFSRRIGLSDNGPIPILAGARLSGNLNKNWRLGLMNIQNEGTSFSEGTDEVTRVKSQNYSVITLQRQVFGTSSLSGIFVNRQSFDNYNINYTDFNRVAGLDFNLVTKDNKWQGKAFYHQSFNPVKTENVLSEQSANATWLMYSTKKVFTMWNHEYVGKNYITDVGFVPRLENYDYDNDTTVRLSYWRFEPMFFYNMYPKSKYINQFSTGLYASIYLDSALGLTESFLKYKFEIKFQNTAFMELAYNNSFIELPFSFDFGSGDPVLAGAYNNSSGSLVYRSDIRKKLHYAAYIEYGSFYSGTKLSYVADIGFRKQPWGIFSISYNRSDIRFSNPNGNSSLALIGPKIELSFSKSLFFTTFIQYNTQQDNVNINTRLQWRFRPMSDIYIVYTDNYQTDFTGSYRAIVLKFIYWINI